MEYEDTKIKGGAFQIARKIFESEVWLTKPSSWKVIWIYILGNVSHKDNSICKKGEGFFQWTKELERVGEDITMSMIKSFCIFARAKGMICSRRTTRGVYITVN